MARWLLGTLGIILLVASAVSAASVRRFAASAMHADAVVVELISGGSHPRLRFTAADGSVVVFPGSGLIFGYRVGDHASVLYSADHPETTATLRTPGSLWFAPLMLFMLGLGGLFVPISYLIF